MLPENSLRPRPSDAGSGRKVGPLSIIEYDRRASRRRRTDIKERQRREGKQLNGLK